MKHGYLSEYFTGAAAKTLASTEIDPHTSRGHEYQGVHEFCRFLGTPAEKVAIPVRYIRLSDDEPALEIESYGTWYDSRRGRSGRHPEYRLYYPAAAEQVVRKAKAGDTLFFCLPKRDALLAISCPARSATEQQLLWLFGLRSGSEDFQNNSLDLRHESGKELSYIARYILELVGIEAIITEDEWLDALLKQFGSNFPSTAQFSAFARKHSPKTSAKSDPDHALTTWIEFEERLFRTLERYIVAQRIEKGFLKGKAADVDEFISFSLSVQNRRKSRVGFALGSVLKPLVVDDAE